MYVIALTGGLGAGKSTASAFFKQHGAVIIDLDEVASHLLGPNSALLGRIVETFGRGVLRPDGSLDRGALAEVAFASMERAHELNAIVHPAVAAEVGPAVAELRLMPEPPEVIVFEVPLLVEAPIFAELADDVLAISAPEELRIERATRRGLSAEDALRRIEAQATDDERAAVADHVIANAGTLEDFISMLDRYWNERVMTGDCRP